MTNNELTTFWAIKIVEASKADRVTKTRSSPENLASIKAHCIGSIGLTAAINIWEEAAAAADLALFGENSSQMSENKPFET